jgi:hypothetical protein
MFTQSWKTTSLAALLLAASVCLAQGDSEVVTHADKHKPLDPKVACSIAGTVTRRTDNVPVKRVVISLVPQDSGGSVGELKSASTDSGGKFSIGNIPPGKYWLSLQKQGFYWSDDNAKGTGAQRTVLSLQPGEHHDKLLFHMTAGGVITGKITDLEGEPIRWATMKALKMTRGGGKRSFKPVRTVQTNDIGEYRLYDLPPGNYFVTAEPGVNVLDDMNGEGAEATRYADWMQQQQQPERLAPSYYPGNPDAGAAISLGVRPGDETRADFMMQAVKAVRVSGRITPHDKKEGSVSLILLAKDYDYRNTDLSPGETVSDDEGAFKFTGVAPGSYYLLAYHMERDSPKQAVREINIGGDDVDGVELTMTEGLVLNGKLIIDGKSDGKVPDTMGVGLFPDGGLRLAGGMANPKRDGELKFEHLVAGKYRVDLFGGGGASRRKGEQAAWYLKSAKLGAQEALVDGIDLNSVTAANELNVVIGTDGAGVDGYAVVADNKPAASALVTLTPQSGAEHQFHRYFKTVADQNGHFQIEGVPPGEYQLLAFEEDITSARNDEDPYWFDAFLDAEFMKGITGNAVAVKLSGGDKASAKVIAVPRESDPQP